MNANRHDLLALGVFGTGSRLSERVALLLNRPTEISKAAAGVCVAVLATVLLSGALAPRLVALAEDPRFEVATVKPSGPTEYVSGMFVYPGGRLTATNFTLGNYMAIAYDVQDFQITGGPKWVTEDRFSVVAQPPAASKSSRVNPSNPKLPPGDEERLMLRSLLADRFHLSVHEETKEGRVYELGVGTKGAKLKPPKDPNDFPVVAYYNVRDEHPETPVLRRGFNATMALLASDLSRYVKAPVLDKTGLSGAYDFEFYLDSTPLDAEALARGVREIGLTLTPARGEVRTLVIDRVEKPEGN